MTEVTTIKVSKPLRARIAADAAAAQLTAHSFLERLVDDYERTQRLAAVAAAYRDSSTDTTASWSAENTAWDTTSTDGLDQ